jgi:hypothetical protein
MLIIEKRKGGMGKKKKKKKERDSGGFAGSVSCVSPGSLYLSPGIAFMMADAVVSPTTLPLLLGTLGVLAKIIPIPTFIFLSPIP